MDFAKDVQVRREKFGAVVFETLAEKVFVANETGADILDRLKNGMSPEEIVAALAQEYDADPEDIRSDLGQFVSTLKDNKIVS